MSEDDLLQNEIQKGIMMNDIAASHQRSVGAIKARKKRIAAKMIREDGHKLMDVVKKMDMSEDDLIRYLTKTEKKVEPPERIIPENQIESLEYPHPNPV